MSIVCQSPPPPPAPPPVLPPCRTSTASSHVQCSMPDLDRERPRPVFLTRPQPRAATSSAPCRTSNATTYVQRSLPYLNREQPRAVSCRALRGSSHASLNRNSHVQCSWPDLNHEQPRAVFPARRQLRAATSSVPCRTATSEHICQKACQKLSQQEVRNAGVMFS